MLRLSFRKNRVALGAVIAVTALLGATAIFGAREARDSPPAPRPPSPELTAAAERLSAVGGDNAIIYQPSLEQLVFRCSEKSPMAVAEMATAKHVSLRNTGYRQTLLDVISGVADRATGIPGSGVDCAEAFMLYTPPREAWPQANPPPPPPPARPKLEVTSKKAAYEYSYLKVVGTLKNNGSASARLARVKTVVLSSDGKVTLAEDETFISVREIRPGQEVAFETITRVPGDPDHIKWYVEPIE